MSTFEDKPIDIIHRRSRLSLKLVELLMFLNHNSLQANRVTSV